jgi:thiosulfate dehydrogenase [quinone] large subunit
MCWTCHTETGKKAPNMATTHRHQDQKVDPTAAGYQAPTVTGALARALAVMRIGFGLTFLWAFFDKLLALGYHTGYDQAGNLDRFGDAAWINGGSPTEGFLLFGADGPFEDIYHDIAGAAWADALFMVGLLGIGLALTLGIGMRVAAATGALLYVLMWTVVLPPENNPVIDDHLLGAVSLIVLALALAGDTWGFGKAWGRLPLVRRQGWLR